MAQRKSWSQTEDRILKDLRQVRLIGKWSQIAHIMKSQFQIFGRNGKQCRERYHNHLDSKICKQKWDIQEERKLLALHTEMGNRWAAISRQLPGRTDNCVKNHFYSYFRKCIKNVNYSLSILSERKIRPLKLSIMNKIISFIEAYHKDPFDFDKNAYEDAKDVKEKIFYFAEIPTITEQNCRRRLVELSEKLADLNKTSRKKYVRRRKTKVHLDESEQVHFKNKDQQFEQQEHFEQELEIKKQEKNVSIQEDTYKFSFHPCNERPLFEVKEQEAGFTKKQEERFGENRNFNVHSVINNGKDTPTKQVRQDHDKHSSYSKLYSADYLDRNYPALEMRDLIFIDDDKEQKFQFE